MLDLFFLVDGSESISELDFEAQRAFIRDITENVISSGVDLQFSLAEFSTTFSSVATAVRDPATIRSRINTFTQSLGITNTGTAILNAIQSMMNNARGGSTQVLVVLTDGPVSSGNVGAFNSAVASLPDSGVAAIAVGIQGFPDVNQLQAIAGGDQSRVFVVPGFDTVSTFESSVTTSILDVCGSQFDRCPSTTPTTTAPLTESTTVSTSQSTSPSTSPTTTFCMPTSTVDGM